MPAQSYLKKSSLKTRTLKTAGLIIVISLFSLTALSQISIDYWDDQPEYIEDAELELVHSDTVTQQETVEVCSTYETKENENGTEYEECIEYSEEIISGEKVEVIEFRNQGFEYLGNGEASISFDARVNQELVGPINSDNFIDNYMLNGERPTEESYDSFADSLQDASFASIGGQINNQEVESSNVNAGWQSMEFVVELEDFRYGGISLNQDSGIRLSTGNYNGGGNL